MQSWTASVNESVHLLDSSSSCIDLIITTQPNFAWSMVFNPLFTQIAIISWYSLSLIFPFILFHYMKEQDLIRTAIDLLDWDKALRFNDVDKQVAIFSDILMNIMQNFVSNETIICDDRDPRG